MPFQPSANGSHPSTSTPCPVVCFPSLSWAKGEMAGPQMMVPLNHTHSRSVVVDSLCLMPVSLMNAIIFWWVTTALRNLTETLKERQQEHKLHMFEHVSKVLCFSIVVGACAMGIHLVHLRSLFCFGVRSMHCWKGAAGRRGSNNKQIPRPLPKNGDTFWNKPYFQKNK